MDETRQGRVESLAKLHGRDLVHYMGLRNCRSDHKTRTLLMILNLKRKRKPQNVLSSIFLKQFLIGAASAASSGVPVVHTGHVYQMSDSMPNFDHFFQCLPIL